MSAMKSKSRQLDYINSNKVGSKSAQIRLNKIKTLENLEKSLVKYENPQLESYGLNGESL